MVPSTLAAGGIEVCGAIVVETGCEESSDLVMQLPRVRVLKVSRS
jgi:hypothetical protein